MLESQAWVRTPSGTGGAELGGMESGTGEASVATEDRRMPAAAVASSLGTPGVAGDIRHRWDPSVGPGIGLSMKA